MFEAEVGRDWIFVETYLGKRVILKMETAMIMSIKTMTSHFQGTKITQQLKTYDVLIQELEESVWNMDDWAFIGDMLD